MSDMMQLHLIAISRDHKKLYTSEGMIIESENPFDIDKIAATIPECDPGEIVAVNSDGEIIGRGKP